MTTLLGKKLGEGGGCSVAIAGGKRQASCNIFGRVLRELCRESTNTTQAISGFHLRWTDAAHSNNYISYACFSVRPTLPVATTYGMYSRCSPCALAMFADKTKAPRSSCSSRRVASGTWGGASGTTPHPLFFYCSPGPSKNAV